MKHPLYLLQLGLTKDKRQKKTLRSKYSMGMMFYREDVGVYKVA